MSTGLDGLSLALSQISFAVTELSKKNYKSNVTEIKALVQKFGPEADCHLFRSLLSYIDFSSDNTNIKEIVQVQFFLEECQELLGKPNFVSVLCYALDKPETLQKSIKPTLQFLYLFSKILKLSKVQEVVFAIGLQKSSNPDFRSAAETFVKQKLPDLLRSYIESELPANQSQESPGLGEVAIEVLHLLLTYLLHLPKEDQILTREQFQGFFSSLRKGFPQERVPALLAPLLYPLKERDEISIQDYNIESSLKPMMEGNLSSIMEELGYASIATKDECLETLKNFGISNINAAVIAQVIGMMSRTISGLDGIGTIQNLTSNRLQEQTSVNQWNIDVFVDVLKETSPNLNWIQVIQELDYPSFFIKDPKALQFILFTFYKATSSSPGNFPVQLIYKPWKNPLGQLSWIETALYNPDIFSFGDLPYHQVNLDILKSPPEDSNREIRTWKSLDLVEILLHLSESSDYDIVLKLFALPVKNCPDILILTLLQVQSSYHHLKNDLISMLMPLFLMNHPNSMSILHYAWNGMGQSLSIRQLVMQSMADWYIKADKMGDQVEQQSRLSRILDVAQDLKALSMLLNSIPYSFVIDLAALASRREYLKLDKWLSDKLREHQEPFAQALVSFLKRRCPQLFGINDKDLPKALQLPAETITTTLSCLQLHVSNFSAEVNEAIKIMTANHTPLLKSRQTGSSSLNSLIMPQPKRPESGGFSNSSLNPLGSSPIGSQPDPFSSAFGLSSSFNTNNASISSSLPGFGTSNSVGQGSSSFGTFGSNSGFSGIGNLTAMQSKTNQLGNLLGAGAERGAGTIGGGLGTSSLSQNPLISQYNTSFSQGFGSSNFGGTSLVGAGIGTNSSVSDAFSAVGGTLNNQRRPNPVPSIGSGNFSSFNIQHQASVLAQSRQADRLKQAAAAGDISAVVPGMDQKFSKEVDDEANSYFQRIYNQPPNPTMSIDEVLEMLKKFKESPDKKEREVFLCMIRNLFEEYRFFPQYPEKELHTTACLFGGIIEQGLVTYMALGIALRYVLEALRKPPGTKMYMFGTTALDRFKIRLKDYPHYCQHLASIPHYKEFPSHLVEYIGFGQRNQEPPSSVINRVKMANSPSFPGIVGSMANRASGINTPTDSITPPPLGGQGPIPTTSIRTTTASIIASSTTRMVSLTTTITSSKSKKEPSIAITTNIDTLLDATEGEMTQPSESIQDKIHFIFNNISSNNMKQKATDLKAAIQLEFNPWLAQYIVMKRVSIEPNFHHLYSDFLKVLSILELSKLVLDETYRNIKVLLRSDKGPANFSDRSLLKNLGHWLGMQTLGNNKPILFKDLEVKSLLIEGFFKGQQELLYVVPFVAKILEACAKSKVFKPPNPWLMGTMAVMAELHQLPDLKLNLKFEVEVLCNTLALDLKDIKPDDKLKDPEILHKITHQLTPPEKEKGSNADQTPPNAGPPVPMFAYHDITIGALAWLAPHIQIKSTFMLFQQLPQLKQYIRPAIERSVQELLFPVVERSMKSCLTAAEMIVKKDFALDPEETRMRTAAHHMVRNVTAGISMITCREPLLTTLTNNIKNSLMAALRVSPNANLQQKDQLDQVAHTIANDNLELCCVFIQKTAVERALHETDKKLATEYELRKHARSESRRYCDPYVLTYQAERMPEQIRLKVGGVTVSQMTVYEEFARSIPGFLPPKPGQQVEPFPKALPDIQSTLLPQSEVHVSDTHKSYMPDDVVHILGKCAAEIEQHIHHMDQQLQQMIVNPAQQHLTQLHNLLDMVVNARVSRDNLSSLRLIRKAVEGVLETMLPADTEMALRYKDCHLIVLRGFQDPRGYGPLWTARQVLKVLADLSPEIRYNFEGIDILCRANLITMREFDHLLAQWIDGGLCIQALQLAIQLCRAYLIEEKHRSIVSETEFSNTLEALARVYQNRQNPEGLATLLEGVHMNNQSNLTSAPGVSVSGNNSLFGRPTGGMHTGFSYDMDDLSGLHEKVEYLLREWVRLYHHLSAGRYSEKAFQAFVPQLHQYGILKTDELITRFFKYCTEMCVDITYRALQDYAQNPTMARPKCFPTIDAYCRLIALLVKHSGDNTNSVTKINLLNRVLGIIGTIIIRDHDNKQTDFHQLPYHRMFVMLLLELNAPESVLEAINFQILSCFANVFHDLRPSRAPGFAYAWLEMIAHRTLMSKLLLNSPQQKGWVLYHQLLLDLFAFLAPFLRNVELAKQTCLLYKGTLRVLLVLLHDFPEFLCDYHFSFCDIIPPNCIQMRNLILSAFPRNMRLPDPFTPNLKVDLLNDIAHPPRILTNFTQSIQPTSFKRDLDSYLKTRAPVTFLSELRSHLQNVTEPGTRYNVPLMNALVLYVGTQAIAYIQSKSGAPSISTITHSSHMDIFQNLAVDLDTEGRYLYLNAIANQLRFPNSHTHYFSCTLLYLFAEANSEAIQEQITRVLLERLIVNRPHPWGLLITFIELIKNHNYNFWKHDFVHCAPEIEKLFESVARSCMQQKQPSRNGSESGD